MRYIKVFTDFAKNLEPLSDAECGRLLRSMLEYAETGAIPELRGNERFVWPLAKSKIDRDAAEYAEMCKRNKRNRTARDQSLPPVTSRDQSSPLVTSGGEEKKAPFVPPSASPLEPPITNPPIIPPKKESPPAPPWGEVPPGPLLDALRDFEQMRVKIRKPMTSMARKLLLGHLRKLSGDEGEQIAILEQSILNGWQDVYALKGGARDGGRQEPVATNLKLGTHL